MAIFSITHSYELSSLTLVTFSFSLILSFNLLIALVKASNPEEQGPYFEGDIKEPISPLSGLINWDRRWPENTVVYKIDPQFPTDFRRTFLKAINHISGRTCIRFKQQSIEADYIYITQDKGCYSFVGKIKNQQKLSLGKGCWPFGTHVHEIIHALGFYHEQSRTDRDDSVKINWENINSGSEGNFKKHGADSVSSFGVAYDYASIMHYSRTAFSKNGKDTIVPIRSEKIGQREKMSNLDIQKVNKMYCPSTLGIRIKNVQDNMYLEVETATSEGKSVRTWAWNDGENQKWTIDWTNSRDASKGSPLVSWSQDGGRIKVMDEDVATSTVLVWGYGEASNQKWWRKEVSASGVSKIWQIVNLETGKCLLSTGRSQTKTVQCNSDDSKQLWYIYAA